MRTTTIGLALAALLLTAGTGDAHGENYRGPNGMVPPGGREPQDPTPPPPPPPGARGFVPPPQPGRPTTPDRPPRLTFLPDFSAWPFWYHYQRDLLEVRPPAALAFARKEPVVAAKILPALLRATQTERHGDAHLAATACVALGRAARTDAHVERLLQVLALAASTNDRQRAEQGMGAVLGLGLLARTQPAERFPAATLDRVRDRLYGVLKNDALPGGLRAAAAFALGLLGDQPTASDALAGATLARLFKMMSISHRYVDIGTACLHAASMQPPSAWTDAQRGEIRALAGGKLTVELRQSRIVRPHAFLVLGRIGSAEDIARLGELFKEITPGSSNLRRSAAIGLGTLAERLDASARRSIAAVIVAAMPRELDPTAHKLLTIALARTAAAELRAGGAFEGLPRDVVGILRATLKPGDNGEVTLPRHAAYAMLGLGLVAQAKPGAAWRGASADDLLRVAREPGHGEPERAAATLALGMHARAADRTVLLDILADPELGQLQRAAAARGLLHIGAPDGPTDVLLRAMFTERAPWMVCLAATDALGAHAVFASQAVLLNEMRGGPSPNARSGAARALANLGSVKAVDGLLARLADTNEAAYVRHAACAALGLVASPEPRSRLGLMVANTNWRANGSVLGSIAERL